MYSLLRSLAIFVFVAHALLLPWEATAGIIEPPKFPKPKAVSTSDGNCSFWSILADEVWGTDFCPFI